MKFRIYWLGVLLAGCTSLPPGVTEHDGYLWKFDPATPVCEHLTWHQQDVTPCGAASCTVGCDVYSVYSEQTARTQIQTGGISEYDHEAKHVFERLRHPTP